MLIQMPSTAAARSDAAPRPLPPCAQAKGLRGLACTGNCGQCSAARPSAGMGALWDGWPAPFNNPLVLAAIAVAILMFLGGGLKLFGGKSGGGRRNAKLRLIRAKAEEERARLLAS